MLTGLEIVTKIFLNLLPRDKKLKGIKRQAHGFDK